MKNERENKTLAVVGGGPAGLFAAVTAAARAKSAGKQLTVRVYDKNTQPARKILVSGNGRCNLSNNAVSARNYPGCNADFFTSVYSQFPNDALVAFFQTHGLPVHTDAAGRIYPRSLQAGAVYDLLLYLCAAAGIALIADTQITSVEKQRRGYLLNGAFYADRLIFACGSAAAPRNGGKGSLFLIEQLGVKTKPFLPALAPIKIAGFSKNQLKGVRAEGGISVEYHEKRIASDRGELQYTDYGLSGIPAMQVSGAAARLADEGKQPDIFVDSLPEFSGRAFYAMLDEGAKTVPGMTAAVWFSGLFPKRLAFFFLRRGDVPAQTEIGALTPAQKDALVAAVKRQRYAFDSVCGFADAQAASGGVPASALDFRSLALKNAPGCYVCGEMADIVGMCGGYNLQWAWSSGYVAGLHAAEDLG